MADLIERLNRCADTCEVYSPDQCATLIDGIGHPDLADLLREAAAALEAAREDAERYRWLRSRVGWMRPGDEAPWTTPSGIYLVATMVSAVYGNCDEQTDAAIDQARGKGGAE